MKDLATQPGEASAVDKRLAATSSIIPDFRPLLSAERASKELLKRIKLQIPIHFGVLTPDELRRIFPRYSLESSGTKWGYQAARTYMGYIDDTLQKVPSVEVLERSYDVLVTAISSPPNIEVNRIAVGWLLDSKTKQAPNPDVYFETIAYDFEDEHYSPQIVVAACQRARRTLKFLPEISELMEVTTEVRKEYEGLVKFIPSILRERITYEAFAERFRTEANKILASAPDDNDIEYVERENMADWSA